MRRTRALVLLLGVLAARAQAPPESPPAPSRETPPAQTQPGPAAAAPAQPAEAQAPSAESARTPAPAEPSAPAPKPAASRPRPSQAPAPLTPDGERDAQLTTLRQEVNRLQSELDAERAAAVPAAEEGAAAPAPARAAWGWLVMVALAALAAGFVLGWRVLDRRIRRKYGGLRIY